MFWLGFLDRIIINNCLLRSPTRPFFEGKQTAIMVSCFCLNIRLDVACLLLVLKFRFSKYGDGGWDVWGRWESWAFRARGPFPRSHCLGVSPSLFVSECSSL